MGNAWFETVAEAQRRAKKRLPPSVYGALVAGSEMGVTVSDNMLDGYQPGDPMVRVFTYQADPAGRSPQEIAAEAFEVFNDHPRGARGADLAEQYYRRRLWSLSFPESHCVARGRVALTQVLWPWIDLEAEVQAEAVSRYEQLRNGTAGQETRR